MSFKFAYKTLINSCGRPAERKSNVKCKNMEKKKQKKKSCETENFVLFCT